MANNTITVITLTKARINMLQRAIASVRQQDYKGSIIHEIIVDNCPITISFLEKLDRGSDSIIWYCAPHMSVLHSLPRRLAQLRNYGVKNAEGRWIAFLDDDNEFTPNHLSSLVECAINSQCPAVHSQRKLYWREGTPYLDMRLPWEHDKEKAHYLYKQLCREGIFRPGSNIMYDRVEVAGITCVDTGEWLLERSLLLRFPFDTSEYSADNKGRSVYEDTKLQQHLIENQVPIAQTSMPTLIYYLGGYSNDLVGSPF